MVIDPDAVGRTPSAASRLDSWKEIAETAARLTTVQRWERDEGLPIHRHLHTSGGSVFAYVEDLDKWLAGRESAAMFAPGRSSPSTDEDACGTPGGAMPLESPLYISRPADDEFRQAIARRAAIVLVKGARQVGKTTLLARALADARQRRDAVAFTDIQALGLDDLRSPTAFYQTLGAASPSRSG
jgi:hypothetical protein